MATSLILKKHDSFITELQPDLHYSVPRAILRVNKFHWPLIFLLTVNNNYQC